jgi:hypothetical protein
MRREIDLEPNPRSGFFQALLTIGNFGRNCAVFDDRKHVAGD